jgi:dihydrofolate reductase
MQIPNSRSDITIQQTGVCTRQLIADLFISLDGFAAGVGQKAFFGYDGPELSSWIQMQLDPPQVILMGRNTYVSLAGFAAADSGSVRMREIPKLVFSNTLNEPLTWNNTGVIGGKLEPQIRVLKQQPGDPIRVFGSLQLVEGLMQLGLVDRLRLMVFPLLLGNAGREPIYGRLPGTALHLVGSKVLDSRLVLLEYELANGIAGA